MASVGSKNMEDQAPFSFMLASCAVSHSPYGNNAFWSGTSYGSASGQSLSTPFYGFSRIAFYQLGLFDLASGDIAWRGEIRTEGKGAANVTNSVFIRSVTSEVANELKASGLIN